MRLLCLIFQKNTQLCVVLFGFARFFAKKTARPSIFNQTTACFYKTNVFLKVSRETILKMSVCTACKYVGIPFVLHKKFHVKQYGPLFCVFHAAKDDFRLVVKKVSRETFEITQF